MPRLGDRDGKKSRTRDAFDAAIAELLIGAGFTKEKRGSWRIYRALDQRIDIVEMMFADFEGRAPYGLTKESFALLAGVFIKGIPHPAGAKINGIAGEAVDSASSCHYRLRVVPSRLLEGVRSQGYWRIDSLGLLTNKVISNAATAVRDQVLPWFDSFRRLDEVLVDSERALEQHKFGRSAHEDIRSPNLVLGFLALKLEDWTLAQKHLAKAREMKNPAHTVDSSAPEYLYGSVRDEIQAGLELARQRAT